MGLTAQNAANDGAGPFSSDNWCICGVVSSVFGVCLPHVWNVCAVLGLTLCHLDVILDLLLFLVT